MKYKTVTATTAAELDVLVQELLDREWEVCGTPYLVDKILHQCVVYDNSPKEDPGLTADDVATLALLGRVGGFRRSRW